MFTLQKDYPSYPKGTNLTLKNGRYVSDDGKLWIDQAVVENHPDFKQTTVLQPGDTYYTVALDGSIQANVFVKGQVQLNSYFGTQADAIAVAAQVTKLVDSTPTALPIISNEKL